MHIHTLLFIHTFVHIDAVGCRCRSSPVAPVSGMRSPSGSTRHSMHPSSLWDFREQTNERSGNAARRWRTTGAAMLNVGGGWYAPDRFLELSTLAEMMEERPHRTLQSISRMFSFPVMIIEWWNSIVDYLIWRNMAGYAPTRLACSKSESIIWSVTLWLSSVASNVCLSARNYVKYEQYCIIR